LALPTAELMREPGGLQRQPISVQQLRTPPIGDHDLLVLAHQHIGESFASLIWPIRV